jgi:hypothetical protein
MSCSSYLLLFAATFVLFSCETASDSSQDSTLTLNSEASLDGYVTSDGLSGSSGDTVNIGDAANDTTFTRCLVSFDLGGLPAGADIRSAVLGMYQNGDFANDSYTDSPGGLGDVIVDNISYAALDAGLYAGSTIGSEVGIGPLASSFSGNTWHDLDVTVALQDALLLNVNGRLQLRIYHHYENDNDFLADTDGWVMGDAPSNQPRLVITYR